MKQFKVFYSWQSDLPGNTNRYFINSCIEEAVENCNSVVEGVEIIADRDTKGMTGSPNISQTIFSKIEECDLFVADVSIVNSHNINISESEQKRTDMKDETDNGSQGVNKTKVRFTPNPNVLIELGYAVKCLGWERVVCFVNTDYGEIDRLPFDLEHQRVTPYSVSEDNKKSMKKQIRGIISDTILELMKTGGRVKNGKSYHVIGSYNLDTKSIDAELVAYDVRKNSWINDYFCEHKQRAVNLINEIRSYRIPFRTKSNNDLPNNDQFDFLLKAQKLLDFNKNDTMVDYSISDSEIDTIKKFSKEYIGVTPDIFDDSFFNVGNMRIQSFVPVNIFTGRGEFSKAGSDEEKEKDKKIIELYDILIEMNLLDKYLKTFDDLLLFPLAIENDSPDIDTDIEIGLKVIGNCETISPSGSLIYSDIREMATEVYQCAFPRDLLYMIENNDIKYDNNKYLYYNPDEPFYENPLYGFNSHIDKGDYEDAIKAYISTPDEDDSYTFNISNLRAKEKKWLRGIIVLRKPKDLNPEVKISYKILSNNTAGDLSGELCFNG